MSDTHIEEKPFVDEKLPDTVPMSIITQSIIITSNN